jgi:hypothetical protein
MREPPEGAVLLFNQVWSILIGVTIVNALLISKRGRLHAETHPELLPGYEGAFKPILVYGSLPWLVMGVGIIVGGRRVTQFMMGRPSDPFVLAFYATIVLIHVRFAWWIFAMSGAEFLSEHFALIQDIRRRNGLQGPSPRRVRWKFGILLLGGLTGMVLVWSGWIGVAGVGR